MKKPKPRFATALEQTLKTFADPIAKRLKVRTGLKAAGVDWNHNRRALAVGQ